MASSATATTARDTATAPCRLLDDWVGPGAMKAMHARGGTVFRLLSSGTIRVGDPVSEPEGAD